MKSRQSQKAATTHELSNNFAPKNSRKNHSRKPNKRCLQPEELIIMVNRVIKLPPPADGTPLLQWSFHLKGERN
jgi:hypothetical protein